MKTEPNDLLDPRYEEEIVQGRFSGNQIIKRTIGGLTKREYFALHILNGLLSNNGGPIQSNPMSGTGYANSDSESVSNWAVQQADSLIEALNNSGE